MSGAVDLDRARLVIDSARALFLLLSEQAFIYGEQNKDHNFVAAYWGAMDLLEQGHRALADDGPVRG